MTTKRLAVVLLCAFVSAAVDLAIGYPELPWWQRFPHDLTNAAVGIALGMLIFRPAGHLRRHAARD